MCVRFPEDVMTFLKSLIVTAAIALFVVGQGVAQVPVKRPNSGLTTWSAFSCATFASLAGDQNEQKRLFNVGYEAGSQFVGGLKDGTTTQADRENAPVAILLLLAGPSTDFIVGRIFEAATGHAFDAVVKEDSQGLPIFDPLRWAEGALRTSRAQSKYRDSNCALVR